MNYWCDDLHLRCFRESGKRHCSLSLLLLYQLSVILTICGCWLLQNLVKRKKSNKFNRLQIEVFFIPNIILSYISPANIGPSNLPFVRIYAQGVLTVFYGVFFRLNKKKFYSYKQYTVLIHIYIFIFFKKSDLIHLTSFNI